MQVLCVVVEIVVAERFELERRTRQEIHELVAIDLKKSGLVVQVAKEVVNAVTFLFDLDNRFQFTNIALEFEPFVPDFPW